jgi:hypothetical protein
MLERKLAGAKVEPSQNPTSFVQRPWHSYTFEKTERTTNEAPESITGVIDIQSQIIVKQGLKADAVVELKVLRARVWGFANVSTSNATVSVPDIEATFYELSADATALGGARSNQRDIGTLNMPAKCGYDYPINDSKQVSPVGTQSVVQVIASDQGTNVTTRVHVLYRAS